MATVPTPKWGKVWLVRFDPSAGAEIRKVRPAVVVNLDAIGRLLLRIVVPVGEAKETIIIVAARCPVCGEPVCLNRPTYQNNYEYPLCLSYPLCLPAQRSGGS